MSTAPPSSPAATMNVPSTAPFVDHSLASNIAAATSNSSFHSCTLHEQQQPPRSFSTARQPWQQLHATTAEPPYLHLLASASAATTQHHPSRTTSSEEQIGTANSLPEICTSRTLWQRHHCRTLCTRSEKKSSSKNGAAAVRREGEECESETLILESALCDTCQPLIAQLNWSSLVNWSTLVKFWSIL